MTRRLGRGLLKRVRRLHARSAASGRLTATVAVSDRADDRDEHGDDADGDVEVLRRDPWSTRACRATPASSAPGMTPAAEATRPTTSASQAIMRRTCLGVAATARRSATSRWRWRTESPMVLLDDEHRDEQSERAEGAADGDTFSLASIVSTCSTSPRSEPVTTRVRAPTTSRSRSARDETLDAGSGEHTDRVDAPREGGEALGLRRRATNMTPWRVDRGAGGGDAHDVMVSTGPLEATVTRSPMFR